MNFEEMKNVLEKYNQNHVVLAYERADEEKKKKILEQVSRIDFENMEKLYGIAKNPVEVEEAEISPMPYEDTTKLTNEEKNKYIKIGEDIIRNGKLAVVTMAGGQGTRLGHTGPKGTYDLGLDSHKTLFEILNDNLKEALKKYNVAIPWYIMTSNENNEDTIRFFEEKNYFGYPKDFVKMFFKQSELPMLDEEGKLIINEEGIIKEAADGHGGVFEAMFKNGVLKEMKENGIEWIFIGGVDNVLVKMADPLFIGFAAANNYMAASKTLEKAYPEEKVGVFCKKDGKPYVIEYTEISDEMANERNEKGELVYAESHVLLNLFNIETLEKIKEAKLPYHSAHKKATYTDEDGKVITPDTPNAYKFESFLFDAFSLLPEIGLLRGIREDEFAPVKNAVGNDSPETAKKLYIDFLKRNG